MSKPLPTSHARAAISRARTIATYPSEDGTKINAQVAVGHDDPATGRFVSTKTIDVDHNLTAGEKTAQDALDDVLHGNRDGA